MNRGMKDSGIKWIGLIPNDWRIGRVKEAFCRQKNKAKQENPIILTLARSGVKVRDISNNEGQLAESYYDYNPVKIGDFLMNTMDLYSGANCSVSKVEGVISPAYANLRAKDNYDPYYYDYYFKTQYWGMVLFAHGKGVSFDHRWTLNNETLMNYYIPIPSEQEQQQIADYLDKKVSEIDSIITQTTLSIEEYKKYKQSFITEVVTKGLNPDVEMKDSGIEWIGKMPSNWTINKFKYIFCIVGGSGFKEHLQGETAGDFPFCKVSDINHIGKYVKASNNYVSKDEVKENHFNIIPKNSVIIAKIGEALKKNHRKINSVDCCIDNNLEAFIPKYKNDLTYLYYLLSSIDMFWFDNQGTIPSINNEKLKNFYLPMIHINEQIAIGNYLDNKTSEIDNNISQKQQLITELENYKKSLIYECVTGKMEVD